MLKKTKIVATLGPASGSPEKLRALLTAGVDVCRINFSHGDPEKRGELLKNVRAVEAQLGWPVAVLGDLCGPKIRVGMIQGEPVTLEAGREIIVQREPIAGTAERISTTLPEMIDVVQPGETLLLADGRLRLEVVRVSPPDEFVARIVVGGPLSSGKGINLPNTELAISALTEKDRQDIAWIAERDFDYVALSFVRRAEDIEELRRLLQQHGSQAQIIAKIEKPQALEQIDAIIAATDAVMVARGDLGVELALPSVPIAQKRIARKCQLAGKPCIIATEMLESMIRAPTPTRAEVSDVANAVFDRADAVMLSAESSVGQFPVETVQAMRQILVSAESFLGELESLGEADLHAVVAIAEPRTTAALAASVNQIMRMEKIAAIALFTAEGTTARLLAKDRPLCPILSLSAHQSIARRAALYFGVVPRVIELPEQVESFLREAIRLLQHEQLAVVGDRAIVLVGHPTGVSGGTCGLIVEDVV